MAKLGFARVGESVHIIAEQSDRWAVERVQTEAERWRPTFSYLSQTEVHVYALSIGASVLLSFFPFLIVMLTLIRDIFHFPAAEQALILALRDYFPGDLGSFIVRNLTKVNHGRFQITSIVLLLFTANGVFEPLEVALNRAWHVRQNRSYIKNQILSFLMLLLCGGLTLGSVLLTAVNTKFIAHHTGISVFPVWASLAIFRVGAIPITILSLFLIYWLLPNRRIPARPVMPVALMVGIALEAMKYLFLFAWPWIGRKFQNEYGPFYYAVSIVAFSVFCAFIVLAGAEWSARKVEHPV
jgi:YihY family inner membrane protein